MLFQAFGLSSLPQFSARIVNLLQSRLVRLESEATLIIFAISFQTDSKETESIPTAPALSSITAIAIIQYLSVDG